MCCCTPIQLCWKNWRLWIRPIAVVVYVLLILILTPLFVLREIRNDIPKPELGPWVGGGFVLLAVPISFWQIMQHLVHYTQPHLQKHIIRILWMVPIYAFNAWFGLVYTEHAIYLNSVRECYEAYVIYNFMKYLLNYLHMEYDLEASLENKPQVKHFFPLCFLAPWEMGSEFIQMCKHGILQYTVFRPVTTIISVICEILGVYDEGVFRGDVAFPYIVVINNISQFVAMYCLVLFYRANKTELQPMRPIGKFLCIKAVVFFSFFQGLTIQILVYTGVISSAFDTTDADTIKTLSTRLQDFLICIEMFLAAIAHHYSFSYKAFINELAPTQPCIQSFLAMWDVTDIGGDLQEYFIVVGNSFNRRIRGRSMYSIANKAAEVSENTRLVGSAPDRINHIPTSSSLTSSINKGLLSSGSGDYGSIGQSSRTSDHFFTPPNSNGGYLDNNYYNA